MQMFAIVATTIFGGVVVFVVGQVILKWFIEPIQQFKKTLAEISNTSVRYAHAIHNPDIVSPELRDEVYDKLRQLSGQLYADMELIPRSPYPVLRWLFRLPSRDNVYNSANRLIGVANWMRSHSAYKLDHTIRNVQAICDNLGLYTDPGDRVPEDYLQKG
jgi:hypothetical protein